MALTSGNSLTAAAALDALFEGGRALGIRERRLGIVGAAGSIGAVLAEVAADDVHSLVLVGRAAARRRLEAVAERLSSRVRVEVAADLSALRACTLVVSATNAARPVIRPEHIGDHPTVLCDVAVPRDVAPEVAAARPRALVLAGGEVRLPPGEAVEIPGLALSGGRVYGCFAETLLLGLGGVREHFSYGPLEADRVRRARALARAHGFSIALRRAD